MSSTRSEPVPTSENGKSRKPKDSDFSQQRMKAVHPVLTAGTVMPYFLIIGIAFVGIGIGMIIVSDQTMELEIDYTDCKMVFNGITTNQPCHEMINQTSTSANCTCEVVTEKIGTGWNKDVMVYYGLTNFFQNHRSYVKSRDDSQLLGDIHKKPSDDCEPFKQIDNNPIIPCGAIANSLFSDTIEVQYESLSESNKWIDVSLNRTGIAWDADKKFKFKNPPLGGRTLQDVLKEANYQRPKNWHMDLWQLDTENEENNGLQNEDLMVWMRTAALPNFRKLYRRINHVGDLADGLPDTRFKFIIHYRFDVKTFSGTKSVVISNTSVLGGKNSFLGIAYLIVGGILVALSALFLYVHFKYGRTLVDEAIELKQQQSRRRRMAQLHENS